MHSLTGKVLGELDVIRGTKDKTGFGYMRIKRSNLVEVLLEAAHNSNIPVRYGKRITSITETKEAVTAIFSDGTTDTADILLGCDGIHSSVRRLYIDSAREPTFTGLAGIGSIIPTSFITGSATPPFKGMHVTMTQEGLFIAMTATASDDEIYWGFSKEVAEPPSGDAKDGWDVRRKKEVEGFKAPLMGLLQDAGGDWGATMRKVVGNTEIVKFYPIYKLPLGGDWSKGRCLLLGDAAHAMPPHAGQGVSMALEDVFLLTRLLEDESRSVGEVYKTFDKIRKPRVDEISTRAAGNAGMRKKTGPWGLWLKELGVRMYMHGAWAFGMDKWGSEQKHMVYDIDEVAV